MLFFHGEKERQLSFVAKVRKNPDGRYPAEVSHVGFGSQQFIREPRRARHRVEAVPGDYGGWLRWKSFGNVVVDVQHRDAVAFKRTKRIYAQVGDDECVWLLCEDPLFCLWSIESVFAFAGRHDAYVPSLPNALQTASEKGSSRKAVGIEVAEDEDAACRWNGCEKVVERRNELRKRRHGYGEKAGAAFSFENMPRAFQAFLLLCLLSTAPVAAQRMVSEKTSDERQIRQVIQTFYVWYERHQQTVRAFAELKVRPDVKAATGVNWSEVARLHAYLHQSAPGLADAYFENDREFLREKDSLFRANPDEEMGFDYDRYTQSQNDPAYLFRQLAVRNRWDITISGDTAYVTAYNRTSGEILDFAFSWEMRKEGGAWKIARIQGDVECRQ